MATRQDFQSGSYNFNTDLVNAGYSAEREFGALVLQNKKVRNVDYNDNKKYDVKVYMRAGTKEYYTFEVKNDMKYSQTGNIGIEFECRGNPSGIQTTEADFWVQKLNGEFWQIHRKKLLELIAEEKYFKIGVGGDEGSNTKMYLFKPDVIMPFMKKYGS